MSISEVRELGDVADFLSGFAWKAKQFSDEPTGMPIIRIQNVGSDASTAFKYWPDSFADRFVISTGDLLLTLSGSFRTVVWSGPDALLNQRIVKVTPRVNTDTRWLFYALEEAMARIAKMGRHALVSNVALSDLRELKINVPPLEEQKRIAGILDQADALRRLRTRALGKLNTLGQAIFHEMFGDPVSNVIGFQQVRFHELVPQIDSGWSPKCLDRPADSDEWGILKLSAVTSGRFSASENKALPDHETPKAQHAVRKGDILFTRKNTKDLVAATVLVDADHSRLLLPDLIFRFRVGDSNSIDPVYFQALLSFPTKRRSIQKLSGGSAGSMPNISKAKLREVQIELPPIDQQREYCRRMAAVEQVNTIQVHELRKTETLFASLQHGAFRGEL
ncbi:restriction endonuclease subunit S [Sulfitobacter guttiformis]|uniref:Type I restriction enzyme S subunit n=1 Tax=Sulfitobacter guttiformis TaxID=74349 RepID=A0A420DTW7_9RHOB|nr:restriction endonuclease subunit S [Sulfitobacter guttiformis]KIN71143.1 Type I restriction modification enzyme protein S [Sulfitobacter guttiformis KCTC 32187]RKE97620.1 type I restriction enzyme S subunit [Sulfitobacter guttiformis]